MFYAKKTEPKKEDRSRKDDRPRKEYKKQDADKNKYFSEKRRSGSSNKSEQGRDNSRIETFKPRQKQDSPWSKRVKTTEQLPSFKGKDSLETQQRKQQQYKDESIIYSENSCKAVFNYRPESIVKAFFTESMTPVFKNLIAWLVEHRLGYDVVTNEQLDKLTQTSHHGGVALIVKKRQPQSVSNYLSETADDEADCVLAIDDIFNPHNLGGIVRTAAFFNVDSIMLRQPALLDSGSAAKVAEGGTESVNVVKSDDFAASIDLFKRQGYQIVAVLPCKVNSIKAVALNKAKLASEKTVLVIFQQVNPKLAELADQVVYLPGSQTMAALNISVLTGIVLSKWQESTQRKK